MKRYELTALGRMILGLLVFAVLMGVFLAANSLISAAEGPASNTPENGSPSVHMESPGIGENPETGEPLETESQETPGEPEETPNGTPEETPEEPGETPNESPLAPGETPAETAPVTTLPAQTQEAEPPDEEEPASLLSLPDDPAQWHLAAARVLFAENTAELVDEAQVVSHLESMLPSPEQMAGYVVIVQGSREPEEDIRGLAYSRAEAVSDLLVDLGVPETSLRLYANETVTTQSKPVVEVSFMEVGGK